MLVTIKMKPFGKERPRRSRHGGVFMTARYQNRKRELEQKFLDAGGEIPNKEHIYMSVSAYFVMPKSWSKKKRQEMEGSPCTKVPDLDNIIGAVMDSLLEDDSMVTNIQARKLWGLEDKLVINVI